MHQLVQQTSLTRRDDRSLAPHIEPAGNALNAGPSVTSLMQLQSMLNGGPAVVAQLQLARGMSRRAASPAPIQRINRTGLPDQLKAGAESLSNLSLDDVQVHYNSAKPATLQAAAFAQGTNIHIGPGQERHLPHEAWHVVQQMQGRVRPTLQAKGVAINDDSELEAEADRMGAQAQREGVPLQMWSITGSRSPGVTLTAAPLQLKWIDSGGGFYRWSKLRGGLRWFYRRGDDKMTFGLTQPKAHPEWSATYGARAGQWLSYQEWVSQGIWGPEPVAEIDAQSEALFQSLARAGQATYEKSIGAARARRSFWIGHAEAEKRNALFDADYATSLKYGEDLTSVYKHRGDVDKREGHGKYDNRFEFRGAGGRIIADSNYQSRDAVKKETLSNSEILFQQLRHLKMAAKDTSPHTAIHSLARRHISGEAVKDLQKICSVLGVETNEEATFQNGTDGFFALLSLANAKSAMWLVADHGEELQINDIRSITIEKGRSLMIEFVSTAASGKSPEDGKDSKNNNNE